MPSHAPRYLAPVKQLETLAKREAHLRHAIAIVAKSNKIGLSAEGAQVAALCLEGTTGAPSL